LVAGDYPVYRLGLSEIINLQEDIVCCGEAASIDETLQACRRDRPAAVVLGTHLGQERATDLLRRLQHEFKEIRALILADITEDIQADQMLQAGASGFVTKDEAPDDVLEAIRTVLAGKFYLSRQAATRLLAQALVRRQPRPVSQPILLSPREQEVFRLLGRGMTSRDIALKLGRSLKTVESHKENIKRKMSLPSTTAVIHSAVRYVEHGAL